ncbi:hypothetical protein QYE76_013030 [Lolium multiflorum]|uniref:Uncharacterized protein n=1 Tax=Lolium multiflorum TaxID=4521 RepID=A0AAD8X470_LOLMU|nr:hypothetical protein QYE76_013030 [Lolium multiflorum]
MENYSFSWETSALMKMAVLMEKPPGHFPAPACRRDCLPASGFNMAALEDCPYPNSEKTRRFAKMQEPCRKDADQRFGVLQARWAIVHHRQEHGR